MTHDIDRWIDHHRALHLDGPSGCATLTPLESFALVGWAPQIFTHPIGCTGPVMTSLVGNAFSAFAFLPVLMLAFSGLGSLVGMPANTFFAAKPLPELATTDVLDGGVISDADDSSDLE